MHSEGFKQQCEAHTLAQTPNKLTSKDHYSQIAKGFPTNFADLFPSKLRNQAEPSELTTNLA